MQDLLVHRPQLLEFKQHVGSSRRGRGSILEALKLCRELDKGKDLHAAAARNGDDKRLLVANSLISMYGKCGSMVHAKNVFDSMHLKDVVSWNALMFGYVENGEGKKALNLFNRMEGCVPGVLSVVAALKACAGLALEEQATLVHGKPMKVESLVKGRNVQAKAKILGADGHLLVASTLVDMYAKGGSMDEALRIFDRMAHRTVVTWTVLVFGYAENGQGHVALKLLVRMVAEGFSPSPLAFVAGLKACSSLAMNEQATRVEERLVKVQSRAKGSPLHAYADDRGCSSDFRVASTLIDMYAKCGCMDEARRVFENMQHRTVVSWTALIFGYAENGEEHMAIAFFLRMVKEGCAPNARTYIAVLKACAIAAALDLGRSIHWDIRHRGWDAQTIVANSLVDFYARCGSLNDAQQVFDSQKTRNLVSWTALMAGYSRQGNAQRVFEMFHALLDKMYPDTVTFLCLLTACNHAGLVDEGTRYFDTMSSVYGVKPELAHYTCMVDMLGRTNQLDQALDLIERMPFRADAVLWTTFLGSCRKWRNVELGKIAFEALLELDETDAGPYVLMAAIYGTRGMWREQSKVEGMRTNARIRKKPGQSWWTSQTGQVHRFMAGG